MICFVLLQWERELCSFFFPTQLPRWVWLGEFSQPFYENPHPIPMALKALEPLEQFATDVILDRAAGRRAPQY